MTSKEDKRNLRILGDNIRRLRVERGWSQEELAFRCALHRTYVGAVERGERNLGTLNVFKIARALGVGPEELLRNRP
jgi:transcriptional regulator with XRE-family HTH domain